MRGSYVITNMLKNISILLLVLTFLVPASAEASYKGAIAGWIPWWTEDTGPESALKHLDEFDMFYPFVYEVSFFGDLVAKADLNKGAWKKLIDEAKEENVAVVPSVMWFDSAAMHFVLADKTRRAAHVSKIAAMVKDGDFDGVNIDYEGKLPQTKDSFSRFLRDLKKKLGTKLLTCTLEARTPVKDLYKVVPEGLQYANDYTAINKYCDQIEIMAYDQQRADLSLNEKRKGLPYAPVADKEWVSKVLELSLKDLDADKVMLGVATYGRAWDITVSPDWYKSYKSVAALNHPRITELSKQIYKTPIGRDKGGEGVISYFPNDSVFRVLNALPTPEGTPKGYEAAAKALLFSNMTKKEVTVRFITWSDAKAIESKLDLAEEYDLKGAAFFKIDGEEDVAIWKLF